MAKKNDILEEQRKARKQFLELKKMQHGEMETGPKPSEVAIVPKTPKEKLQNIWFHYKWLIIGTVFAAIVLAVMITQCATKPKYDLEVIFYTYEAASDKNLQKLGDYLEQYCEDIDGDGKVSIQVINCSVNKDSSDVQYQSTIQQKFNALLSADPKALLIICDEKSFEFLQNTDEDLIYGEPVILSDKLYAACEVEDGFSYMPDNLMICCRDIEGKNISKEKNVKVFFKQSQKIMKALETEISEQNLQAETQQPTE